MKIALFHEFHKPPYGGGNQFLLALRGEFQKVGHIVLENKLDRDVAAVIFNSFNFDADRLKKNRKDFPSAKFIHRVDGPIGLYRGEGPEVDQRIAQLNDELADTTVFQSKFSLKEMNKLGLKLTDPHIITNASDPKIFYPEINPARHNKIRIIATSWSNNLNKGAPIYAQIEKLLDWEKYEFRFVGRSQIFFDKIKTMPPLDSVHLANELRSSDIYLTASENDPCSNSLIEALSCGLPAVYLKSGGHPEIVGKAGVGFVDAKSAVAAIERVAKEINKYSQAIKRPSISDVAHEYMRLMPEP